MNKAGLKVKTRHPAPRDDWSHLPRPLLTSRDTIVCPPPGKGERYQGTSWHHGNFPGNSLKAHKCKVQKPLGMLVMRFLGKVHVPNDVHVLFHLTHDGSPVPETIEEQMEAATLAAGGYVPPLGVTVTPKGETQDIPLERQDRLSLISTGTISIPDTEALRPFFYDCIVNQRLSRGQRREYAQLLGGHLGDPDFCRGRLLGICQIAFEPAAQKFAEAYDARLLPRANSRDVGQFVCGLLFDPIEQGGDRAEVIANFRDELVKAA